MCFVWLSYQTAFRLTVTFKGLINNILNSTRKKVELAYLRYYPTTCLKELRKLTTNPTEDCQCIDHNSHSWIQVKALPLQLISQYTAILLSETDRGTVTHSLYLLVLLGWKFSLVYLSSKSFQSDFTYTGLRQHSMRVLDQLVTFI